MAQIRTEDMNHIGMQETLLKLGYERVHVEELSEPIDFFLFHQPVNDKPTLIIAAYYHETLTLTNMKPLFNQGHDIMMNYLNQDEKTQVAFLVLLTKGVSPSILVMRAFTEPVIRIMSDTKLRPTVIFSEKKAGMRILQVLSKLVGSLVRDKNVTFDEGYDENNVESAHKRAVQLAC